MKDINEAKKELINLYFIVKSKKMDDVKQFKIYVNILYYSQKISLKNKIMMNLIN